MSIENRYDFVLLFDVKDGNPNGDPDAGNLPRLDAETGQGLVTDVCLKRKIRNYVSLVNTGQPRFNIYIKEKAILNDIHEEAYKAIGAEHLLDGDSKKRKGGDKVNDARQWLCDNFYDIRTFGAVMSTGVNCGQVRGPVQLTFARSNDPIISSEHAITRMAVTTKAEAEKQDGDNRTMGRKFTVPYGLYRSHGFISASLAEQTGFDNSDLDLLIEALTNMFEHDRSAARGEMNIRGLYLFKHQSKLGNAHAKDLFNRITLVNSDPNKPPRCFEDYQINVNTENLPEEVILERVVG
ncbi:MAG: type I-C CRISPR-associated protein Cas7/Csd2 [Legionellales bacterium]|nr:type I-C CRISPR-associated protein Cas7/Csd2 [Legionellales bacterium]